MKLEINHNRCVLVLQGVTGSTLRILGMVKLVTEAGNDMIMHRWVPVVPNLYLDAGLLLRMDVLGQDQFQYYRALNQFLWGGTKYVVNHIKKQRCKVEQALCIRSQERQKRRLILSI